MMLLAFFHFLSVLIATSQGIIEYGLLGRLPSLSVLNHL